MGLIGDYIEVGLNGTNIKHFEDLGYQIPRVKDKWGKIIVPRGTKIKVKIEDLTQYSKATVSLECDCCHKIYDTTYAIISNRFDFLSKFDSQFKLLYSNKLNNSSNILNDICNENIYVVNNFKEIYDFINFDR